MVSDSTYQPDTIEVECFYIITVWGPGGIKLEYRTVEPVLREPNKKNPAFETIIFDNSDDDFAGVRIRPDGSIDRPVRTGQTLEVPANSAFVEVCYARHKVEFDQRTIFAFDVRPRVVEDLEVAVG